MEEPNIIMSEEKKKKAKKIPKKLSRCKKSKH